MLDTFLFAFSALLAVLNAIGGVVTFIWLIVLGQWWAIGYGFCAIPATVALYYLARLIQWIRVPALSLIDRKQGAMAYLCHLLCRMAESALAALWFAGALFFFSRSADRFSFWPLVVWSYSMALAAWAYMSRMLRKRDTGDIGGDIVLLSVQAAYLTNAALILGIAIRPPLALMEIFAAIVFAGAVAASVTGFVAQKRRAALGTVYTRNPHA